MTFRRFTQTPEAAGPEFFLCHLHHLTEFKTKFTPNIFFVNDEMRNKRQFLG